MGGPLAVHTTLEQRSAELGYTGSPRKAPAEGPLRGLAVQNITPAIRKQLELAPDVHGVVVSGVDPSSPAAQYLEPGDVILSVNQQPVNSVAEFNKLAAEAKGQTLLRVLHQGSAVFIVIPDERSEEK